MEEKLFSERQACMDCGVNIPTLEPRSFSFNSRYGACPECDGPGTHMVHQSRKPDSRSAAADFRPSLSGAKQQRSQNYLQRIAALRCRAI